MGQFGVYPLSAPVGGLNTIDPISLMPETDAIELLNLYPEGSRLVVRGGHQTHADNGVTVGALKSLFTLPLADGTEKLLAASSAGFYDSTSAFPTVATGATVPTSGEWNGGVFRHKLWLCNGTDTVQVWSGSGTLTDATYTGVTLSTLINQSVFGNRNYFVERNSASFWYSNEDAENGTLTEYALDSFLRRGGRLLFAGSYTDRLTSVTNDLFMACSSEGELLFYQGLYPGDATTPWKLMARYEIGKPLGYRAFVRVDSDIWILTEQGIVPVSLLFSGQTTVAANSVSRKVNTIIRSVARSVGPSYLWAGLYWHAGKRVYITIPKTTTDPYLLVCNIETGAWARYEFSGSARAYSLATMESIPYFGSGDGVVYSLEQNQNDNGNPIEYDVRLAFSFYGTKQNFKIFKEIRMLLFGLGGTETNIGFDTDFQLTDNTSPIQFTSGTETPWYSDWYSDWSTPETYLYSRFGLSGSGHSGSLRVQGDVTDHSLSFSVFEVRYEAGAQR